MRRIANSNNARRLEILVTPGFLMGITLLLLNDFYLKQTYANFFTGKLSDFSGLFTFSLFLTGLFPQRVRSVQLLSALAFVYWKTPLADGLIAAWNSLGIMSVTRTVDYSDYIALTALPLSYAYFTFISGDTCTSLHALRRAGISVTLIVSLFAFGATSTSTSRSITLPETYAVRESRVEIEGILLHHPRIKDLLPEVQRTAMINGSNVTLDRPVYHFGFKVEERTCDSRETQMSVLINERRDHTELAAINIRFDCGDYRSPENYNALDKTYIEQTKALFEREIVSKLTPVNPNDKTPRPRP